jgi:hypothetical protein
MSLDGLRAWIGEVERKLGMRTRVFLALTVIAIGGAGAGIYLAIDARESSVSQDDVQALQEKLEARIGGGGAGVGGTEATRLEVEIDALRAEVEKLKGEGGGAKRDKSGGGATPSDGGEGTNGASAGGTGAGGAPGGGDASSAKLQELLEQAKDQNAQAK